ncbi:MAG: beta-galactosidase [Lachnospiraceae bacterium]|nr:beta-galactosidase [Lachnospiraceae bacterium]
MILNDKVQKILFGGDYNPEQWPEEVWEEDMRLFRLAHIDVVTLNVFSWAALQPDEDTYDFSRLDRIMELVKKNGIKVCLATSTAAHPAWMARKHPDILRMERTGMKRKFGSRHNSCPNSPTYRKYSVALAEKLAERYRDYDNIVAWHIANEYGGECYCDNCEKAFRIWLKEKYGTIEELNRVWNTAFWSHTMYDFEDVVVPDLRSEEFEWGGRLATNFQGISLDYNRFNSDSILACYRLEEEAVKKYTPDIPVTTNLMGTYKTLDYFKWGKHMDFISWDNYPDSQAVPAQVSLRHDLMRGLKGGMPFALMEQTPSVSNWHAYCKLKRPGVMRLWSYQAVAHGADTVMFFQMRRSIGACEKYHGAVIDHVGTENTRVFREIAALGEELDRLGNELLGGRTPAKAAIVFDWDNWWAAEYSAGPSKLINYCGEVMAYYKALNEMNIAVDIIDAEKDSETDLSDYRLVIAPLLYMCKDGFDERIRSFVKSGGTFLTTFFGGYVEDHDLVVTGGYPGRLKDILGIWVEETDALPEGEENSFFYKGKKYPATLLCDLLHLQGAESLASYESDFYEGMPVLTCNRMGEGKAYYVASRSDDAFYRSFLGELCEELGIEPAARTPEGVEAAVRENENGSFLFLLNHTEDETEIILQHGGTELLGGRTFEAGESLRLPKAGVAILKRD